MLYPRNRLVVVLVMVAATMLLAAGIVQAAEPPQTAHVNTPQLLAVSPSNGEGEEEGGAQFWYQTPSDFAVVNPSQVARSPRHQVLIERRAEYLKDLRALTERIKAANPRFIGPATISSQPIGGMLDDFAVMDVASSRLRVPEATMLNSFDALDDIAQGNLTGFLTTPPDPTGDIGATYYVEAVNNAIAVYDRAGGLVASWASVDLWAGLTNCSQYASGDDVVLYDQDAQRWLITEMALSPDTDGDSYHYLCFAVSQTDNPSANQWYTYEFRMPVNIIPDYPKYGIWVTDGGTQNGYYFTYNGFDDDGNWQESGAGLMAVERDKMLVGDPSAQLVGFHLLFADGVWELLPAHWEGTWNGATKPPDVGDVFIDVRADEWGYASDYLEIYRLTVDWQNGTANYVDEGSVALNDFVPAVPVLCSWLEMEQCVPQQNTTRKLDILGERPMFPLSYINFGDYGSYTFNFTGTDNVRSFPVWFEVREDNTNHTFSLAQQGDMSAIDDGDSHYRWIGTIAQDRYGNMLLAYSTSGTEILPELRYTGRLVCDPPNTMTATETTFAASTVFYQDSLSDDNRWGDYNGMGIDPLDGVTFWAVGEYATDALASYNWATRVVQARFETDLQVTKTAPATVNINEDFSYTVTVTNAGPSDACGVVVTDTLPADVTFVSASTSTGAACTHDGAAHTVTCDLGRMDNGDVVTITINVTAPATPGTITNTAEVEGSIYDGTTANNTASASTDVVAADLSLSKTIDNTTPTVGENVTFTLTLNNGGPNDATGVQVTDTLPNGYTLVSANPSGGTTYDSNTGVWDVGTLANGGSATLDLVATVEASGDYTNTAEVTASDLADPDSTPGNGDTGEDDYAEAAPTSVTPLADLSLSKVIDNANPIAGENVTFTLTLHNDGPNEATGVEVTDQLPDGYTFVSANAGTGSYDSGSGVWDVGTVAANGDATLTITATVNGNYKNTAEVTASDAEDPDSTPANGDTGEDDYAEAEPNSVTPAADLSLSKTIDNTTPTVGDNVTFTLTLHNDGPSDATGVQVTDTLPTGYTFVSANASPGSYDDNTGVWDVGTVAANGDATLTITATVNASGNYKNTAEVTASDAGDPDSTPGNGDTGEDDYAEAEPNSVTPAADLSLSKTIDNTTPTVGDNVTFTLTLHNDGPNDATGVEVTDQLPDGYTFVSANADTGSYDSGSGVWDVGTVAANGDATLTITTVNASGNYKNTAEVTASDADDPDSTPANGDTGEDDYAEAEPTSVTPVADLSLTKTIDNATPTAGDNVTFTLTLHNDGPSDATGVEVTDQLPDGYTFVSANADTGSYDSGSGVWDVGTVAANGDATLTIRPR